MHYMECLTEDVGSDRMEFRQLTAEEVNEVFPQDDDEAIEVPLYETLAEAEEAEGPLDVPGPTEPEESEENGEEVEEDV